MKLLLLVLLVPCLALGDDVAQQTHRVVIHETTVAVGIPSMLRKHLENTASIVMMNSITAENYTEVVNVLNSKTFTENDWEIVFADLNELPQYGLSSIYMTGNSIPFGRKKVLFYLTLIKYYTEKQGDKVAELMKSMTGVTCQAKLDHLVNFYPELGFMKIERDIWNGMRKGFANILLSVEPIYDSEFHRMDWPALVQFQLDKLEEGVLPIQALLNATAWEHFHHVKLDELIGQIERLSNNGDNNRIVKHLLYTALIHASNKAVFNREIVEQYFKLIISWKTFWPDNLPTKANSYFKNHIAKIEETVHGCAKSALYAPPKKQFFVHNTYFNELLVLGKPAIVRKTMPTGWNKDTYYPALVWTNSYNASDFVQFQNYRFYVEHDGDRFFFDSASSVQTEIGRILDASHSKAVHFPRPANKRDGKYAFKLIPSTKDNKSCYFQHYDTRRVIYGSPIRYIEDLFRRQVVADGTFNDIGNLWAFRDVTDDRLTL